MSDVVVVVVGSLALLCLTAVFALVFRPSDFRRHGTRDPKLRRPGHSGAPYVHSGVVLPPNYTPAESRPRWPPSPPSDGPQGR